MTNIKCDDRKYKEMEDFLNYVLVLFQDNPELKNNTSSKKIIYNLLKTLNLKETDLDNNLEGKDISNINFKYWIKYFEYRKNINVFHDINWDHFCQFIHPDYTNEYDRKHTKEFIKLYIPIDAEHITSGVTSLFDFLDENNIYHVSKVARIIRTDNVIVRLQKNDYENALKIIDFVNNNDDLKEGLNSPNPFVPCINGIGIMEESGISYNAEISKCIDKFIRKHLNEQKVTIADFKEEMPILSSTEEVQKIFNQTEINLENDNLNYEEQCHLLVNALKATYDKYGYDQAFTALKKAINSNYFQHFTNGEEQFRTKLKANADRNNMIKFIKEVLKHHDTQNMSTDELISLFCQTIFHDLERNKLNSACSVTLKNYNQEWLNNALKNYIIYDLDKGFSRYSKDDLDHRVNYREIISEFSKENMLYTIEEYLNLNGIMTTDLQLEDIIASYTDMLQKNMELDNKNIIHK